MKRKFLGKYELTIKIYQMQIIEKRYQDGWTFNKIKDYLYLHNKDIPSNVLYSNLYNYIDKGIIKCIRNKEVVENKINKKLMI